MNKTVYRVAVVTAVVAAIAIAIVAKQRKSADRESRQGQTGDAQQSTTREGETLPQLLDFGGGVCTPCKLMEPIIEELARDYRGRVDVRLINKREQPALAEKHGIQLIPTQVFLDAAGKEVLRHTGFMPKEDIVAKLKEMGVE